MNFQVVNVSRGDVRLKSVGNYVRVLGEALNALAPDDPSYVIYLNSLNTWESPPDVELTELEKNDVISAIRKHFQDRGSIVDFEY